MKNIIYIFITSLMLTAILSCSKEEMKRQYIDSSNQRTRDLVYTKDYKSNLCFAWSNPFSQGAVMSNVPCTTEVEKLIKE